MIFSHVLWVSLFWEKRFFSSSAVLRPQTDRSSLPKCDQAFQQTRRVPRYIGAKCCNCLFSIPGFFDQKPAIHKDLLHDLSVQRIVFHQKDSLPRQGFHILNRHGNLFLRQRFSKRIIDRLPQVGKHILNLLQIFRRLRTVLFPKLCQTHGTAQFCPQLPQRLSVILRSFLSRLQLSLQQ